VKSHDLTRKIESCAHPDVLLHVHSFQLTLQRTEQEAGVGSSSGHLPHIPLLLSCGKMPIPRGSIPQLVSQRRLTP
jgi:hypothetical protein